MSYIVTPPKRKKPAAPPAEDIRHYQGPPQRTRLATVDSVREAYLDAAEAYGAGHWIALAKECLRVCDHWANLTDDERESLAGEFPNAPAFLGDWSGMSWVAYVVSRLANEFYVVERQSEALGSRDMVCGRLREGTERF